MSVHETDPNGLPRLLVLASTYPRWGGDPEPGFVHELARRLTGQFEVTVLCPHAKGALRREVMDDVRVIRYRYAPDSLEVLVNDGGIITNLRRRKRMLFLVPAFLLGQAWSLWRLQRSWRPAVIHAHWLIPQGLLAALLTVRRGSPAFLVTSHGADLYALRGGLLNKLKRFVLSRARIATVVSEGMRSSIESLRISDASIHVEPMGVDLKRKFTPDPRTQRSTNELLFVGRLVEKKGLIHLIDAMPAIIASWPDATLTVVGFGPEEAKCRARVRELNLQSRVTFAGAVPQSDLPAYYRRAALFVAPFVESAGGDQEGLGLVLIEALGCGCPAVVSRLPATEQLVSTLSGVSPVPPGDPVALSNSILQALEVRPQVDQISLEEFDWERRAQRYAALLSECVK